MIGLVKEKERIAEIKFRIAVTELNNSSTLFYQMSF